MVIKRPKNFFGEYIPLTVFLSEEQVQAKKTGTVYGKYFEDTGIFNLFPEALQEEGDELGEVLPLGSAPLEDGFWGIITETGVDFFWDKEKIVTESYGLYQSIFSRNKGILETGVMGKTCAVILGCGSVGSLVSLELARAGVGHFVLCDADTLEYHNVCRHQCGIQDVGDLKVNVMKRKILNINPSAKVEIFGDVVENIPKTILDDMCVDRETVFVGCADNRGADVYANKIADYYKASFLSIGFWERAFVGEIFYYLQDAGNACYKCALGSGSLSGRVTANHHVYSNQENVEAVKFEPGISVDINFITSIGIKLLLDILNRKNPEYRPRLLNKLTQYTLVCNTSDTEIGGDMVEIFSYPLQVTTSLMVNGAEDCDCQNPSKEEGTHES